MERFVAVLGIFIFMAIAYSFSSDKKHALRPQLILWGLGLQLLLVVLVLGIPGLNFSGPLKPIFNLFNDLIVQLLNFSREGSAFVFGDLVKPEKIGFIFATQVLPTIIFISSLMAVLYHWGWMQKVVKAMAWLMQKTMKTSGPESLAMAANVFVGQTEAPLVVRPYVPRMTRSEVMTLMVGGMATVAGGVMAAYVGLLRERIPDIAGHLLTASLMSAPAALLISKLLVPEKKISAPSDLPEISEKSHYRNTIEAAAEGAGEGLKLALNVAAMLLAFIALMALANACLSGVGSMIGVEGLSLQSVLGYFLAPVAWLMGISWSEASIAGALIGEKIILNEFVAYLNLSQMQNELSDRSVIIMSYALCGFANFSSIAIQIGGIGELAPSRKSELAELGLRAVLGGSLAAFMTAAMVSIFI